MEIYEQALSEEKELKKLGFSTKFESPYIVEDATASDMKASVNKKISG